jgi:putative ABC transport system permease protein
MPPTLWLSNVRALLPRHRREEIEGDLIETWSLTRRRGRLPAARAFWSHASSIVLRRHRLSAASPVAPHERRSRVVLDQLRSDLRYSARLVRRRPGFAALTIATLALGIGASTAVFTIADRVLFRPLPYPDPARIVAPAPVTVGFAASVFIAPEFLALREFTAMGMYGSGGLNLGDQLSARRVRAAAVNSGFFEVLGVPPLAGRTFTTDDDRAQKVIVLGFDLWRHAFAGDRTILERTIPVNDQPFRVIGIMPRGFSFPERSEVWLPPLADRQVTGAVYSPQVFARLARGVSSGQAVVALSRAVEARTAAHAGHHVVPFGVKPRMTPAKPPTVTSLQVALSQGARPTLAMLVIIVAVLLVAACANVAGLLLSRLRTRERELLVRSALGANRLRLVQQLTIESIVIAAAGAVAGIALGFWAVRLFVAAVPTFVPDIVIGGLDLRFFAIGGFVTLLCAGAFALGPAITASAAPASRIVNDATGGSPSRRFGGVLIVLQVAAALLLLAATSASTSAVLKLMRTDLGFSNDRAVVFDLTLPETRYRGASIGSFVEPLLERLATLPGVVNVGAPNFALGSSRRMIAMPLWLEGAPEAASAPDGRQAFAIRLAASPRYFQAMGIPLVSGRFFTTADRKGAPPVVILSESAARRLKTNVADVIGKRLALDPKTPAEIVGVVGSVRLYGPTAQSTLEAYEPIAQSNQLSALTLAIDSTASTDTVVAAAKQSLAELDSSLPLYNIQQLGDVRATFVRTERVTAALSGLFALLALILSGIGLYGVLAQLVTQRTREIGIRMALGADRRQLQWSVVAAGLRLAIIGVIVGAIGAKLTFRAAARFVPQLEMPDSGSLAATAVLLLTVAAVAAWLPARRASAVDPVCALRAE